MPVSTTTGMDGSGSSFNSTGVRKFPMRQPPYNIVSFLIIADEASGFNTLVHKRFKLPQKFFHFWLLFS